MAAICCTETLIVRPKPASIALNNNPRRHNNNNNLAMKSSLTTVDSKRSKPLILKPKIALIPIINPRRDRPFKLVPLDSTPSKPLTISASAHGNKPLPERKVSPSSMQWESRCFIPNESSAIDDGESGLNAMEYSINILASNVHDVANESPLLLATRLYEHLGVFSYKIRGAYHVMAKLSKEQLDKGVICSSTGYHGLAVALAARKLGCDAVIAMPAATPELKWKTVEELGGTVVLVEGADDEAETYAKRRGAEEGRTFIE